MINLKLLAMQRTFYRAFSLVNGGRKMETDLFEGIQQPYRDIYVALLQKSDIKCRTTFVQETL